MEFELYIQCKGFSDICNNENTKKADYRYTYYDSDTSILQLYNKWLTNEKLNSMLFHFNEKKAENKNWTQISKLNIAQIPNFNNNNSNKKMIIITIIITIITTTTTIIIIIIIKIQ